MTRARDAARYTYSREDQNNHDNPVHGDVHVMSSERDAHDEDQKTKNI